MAHDDVARGHRTGQVHDIRQLRMKQPGIQGQAQRRHPRQPAAKVRAHIRAQPGHVAAVADRWVRIPAGGMAHPAEPPAAGADMGLQHLFRPVVRQVYRPDDARGHPRGAVAAAVAHRGDAGDELRLPDRSHLFRPIRAIHRMAFQKHRRDGVVAGVDVRHELVQQIALVVAMPQVMMGIDDRQVRFQRRLGCRLRQPGRIGRVDMAVARRLTGRCHLGFPLVRSRDYRMIAR